MARLFNGATLTALVAGFVGGILAPMLLPNGARSVRPVARSAIKAGLAVYERGRERIAEWGETVSDLVAEVQAEREEEFRSRRPAPHRNTAAPHRNTADVAATAMISDDEADATRGRRYDA